MIHCWLLLTAIAHAGIVFEPAPQLAEETVLTVLDEQQQPVAGATVRAFHREGLAQARELAIGITDIRGRVKWTPAEAGPVRVDASKLSAEVFVAWPAPPADTVIPWLLIPLAGLPMLWLGRPRRRAA
jgi:hypothetical protein